MKKYKFWVEVSGKNIVVEAEDKDSARMQLVEKDFDQLDFSQQDIYISQGEEVS